MSGEQRPLSERDLLEQDLRQKYLRPGVSDEVAIKVFRKAWEDGHSAGNHEVEMHYDDLSEIANAAFKAGQGPRLRHEIGRITERPSQGELDRMLDLITSLGEDSPLGEFLMDIWRRIYRGEPVVLYATP